MFSTDGVGSGRDVIVCCGGVGGVGRVGGVGGVGGVGVEEIGGNDGKGGGSVEIVGTGEGSSDGTGMEGKAGQGITIGADRAVLIGQISLATCKVTNLSKGEISSKEVQKLIILSLKTKS